MKKRMKLAVPLDMRLISELIATWLDRDSLYSVKWLPADITLVDKIKEYL